MRGGILSFLLVSICCAPSLWGQSGLLNNGKWVKIGTTKQGIYKINGSQLQSMGFTLPLKSSQLQLYGFQLDSLNEKVPQNPTVGLTELAIELQDGGDGQFDEKDQILFYAPGTIRWKWELASLNWAHQKMTTNDTINYYVTIGNNGKRIPKINNTASPQKIISTFQNHWLFETDTINLLNSGKQWLGLPMGTGVGKVATISYPLNFSNLNWEQPVKFICNYAAASYGSPGIFDLKINDIKLRSTNVGAVSGLVYDAAANLNLDIFSGLLYKNDFAAAVNNISLNVQYAGSSNSTGWIDYIEMHANTTIDFGQSKSFGFNVENTDNIESVAQINIGTADSTVAIWNVSNPFSPIAVTTSLQNNLANFNDRYFKIQDYFAVKQSAYEIPHFIEAVANQNLANLPQTDYLIVSATDYMNAANKLQKFHIDNHQYKVAVVSPAMVFNEFSGGQSSPIAIRNFIKYLINRANLNGYQPPKYLLLLGIGNFNAKKINLTTQVPCFESSNSNELLNTYTSDDFYAITNTGNDINYPNSIRSLGLSVGRIPAKNRAEADTAINKLIQYQSKQNKGAWRNQLTWIADDGDYNLHLQDAEAISQNLKLKEAHWNFNKIYLDLFSAIATSSGLTYPLVNNEIKQSVNNGTLILNYTGHGNYLRLSEEAVISQKEMQQWNNANTLPLLITASCDFAPFDQPQLSPIGFESLLQNKNGVVGLVSASRLVFAYSNKQINDLYIQKLLVSDSTGIYPSIGQALVKAKMENWSQNGDHLNAFKFNLMGDPALELVHPTLKIVLDKLNQNNFISKDTLVAGIKSTIKGSVRLGASLQSDFNGVVDFILFNSEKEKSTLGNQPTSLVTKIKTQESILFRGKATVANGLFTIDFIVPLEVSTLSGPLRMQCYAYNELNDALGVYDSIYVKNNSINTGLDKQGPTINTYITDTNFISGTWVSSNSNLLVHLKDSSGIQTSGDALGHDLQLIIDQDFQNPIVLNNYYTAAIDTYNEGWVKYALPKLAKGKHELMIKAWDLVGNSSKDSIYFEVPSSSDLMVMHLSNTPNPFIAKTRFSFDVNLTNLPLSCTLTVYNTAGVTFFQKTLNGSIESNKWVIDWDGQNEAGVGIAPGLYFYKIAINYGKESVILSNKLIKL